MIQKGFCCEDPVLEHWFERIHTLLPILPDQLTQDGIIFVFLIFVSNDHSLIFSTKQIFLDGEWA